jgi:CRISPR system Cascade subunit CasA
VGVAYNLMEEAWLHVEYDGGFRRWIAPWQIAEKTEHGLPTAFCSGRPDLDGAMTEFVIGLVQTVFCPEKRREWKTLWKNPPDAEALKDRFTAEDVKSCFELLGDGHCFMQDEDPLLDAVPLHIEALLIDAVGRQTEKRNTDLFVKRSRVDGMCLRCAAQSLFCLQTYAPAGGSGIRTSVRGGGPLTTIAVGGNLLETAILNMTEQPTPREAHAGLFPWMSPTRTSEKGSGCITTPDDVHPLQVFWGMPRRVRLCDVEHNGSCDLCGADALPLIRHCRTRARGTNYEGGWCHPLSPHRMQDNAPIPIHGHPGWVRYRAWLGAILGKRDGSLLPARAISRCLARLADGALDQTRHEGLRVRAFGYDMDNAKARGWYEGQFPVLRIREDVRGAFAWAGEALVTIADSGAGFLRKAILSARDPDGHKTKSSSGELSHIGAFWAGTETEFYQMLNRAHRQLVDGITVDDVYRDWLAVIRKSALRLFDEAADVAFLAEHGNPRAVVKAREKLAKSLSWTKWWRERLDVADAQEEGRDAG